MPPTFFEAAKKATGGRIATEFLQPQIEVISSPHTNMADARAELRHLRRTVAAVAAEHGLAILAAGTHPTALWRSAIQTPKERYDAVMDDLQMIGQRDLLCGLHVHVELPDPDERIERHVSDAAISAAVPGAVDLLAVLAVAGYRTDGLSACRL